MWAEGRQENFLKFEWILYMFKSMNQSDLTSEIYDSFCSFFVTESLLNTIIWKASCIPVPVRSTIQMLRWCYPVYYVIDREGYSKWRKIFHWALLKQRLWDYSGDIFHMSFKALEEQAAFPQKAKAPIHCWCMDSHWASNPVVMPLSSSTPSSAHAGFPLVFAWHARFCLFLSDSYWYQF